MTGPVLYARLIAGFPADVAPAAVEAVIALARALGAPLHAVLLEDLTTLALAERPSARAFDPRSAGWREVRPADLEQALQLAASLLGRQLEAARRAGVQAQDAARSSGVAFGQSARPDDLLVVTEPAEPMACWTQPFAGLVAAALAAPAALLYLPQRGARAGGPIVGLGSPAAIELAQRLAQSLGSPLVAAGSIAAPQVQSLHDLLPALQARRVRVVVCSREALLPEPRAMLHEAAERRIAVLLAPGTAQRSTA
jgi:hypothetical protein